MIAHPSYHPAEAGFEMRCVTRLDVIVIHACSTNLFNPFRAQTSFRVASQFLVWPLNFRRVHVYHTRTGGAIHRFLL
jgi:hypothetical protein